MLNSSELFLACVVLHNLGLPEICKQIIDFPQPSRFRCVSEWQVFSGVILIYSFVDGEALPQSLLPLCDELLSVIDSLQHSYNKMVRWDEAMSGICELIGSQNKASHIIFQVCSNTWIIWKLLWLCVSAVSCINGNVQMGASWKKFTGCTYCMYAG